MYVACSGMEHQISAECTAPTPADSVMKPKAIKTHCLGLSTNHSCPIYSVKKSTNKDSGEDGQKAARGSEPANPFCVQYAVNMGFFF